MLSISDAIASAYRAYQTGNLFEAEWMCQQIVEQQPDAIAALHLLGAIAQQTGRLGSAIARYQQILTVDPNHFEAHNNLAVALQDRNWQEAAKHFQQAIRLNPDHAPAHFNFGNLLQQQQDYAGAIAHYQQAIALNPNHVRAHNNLGNALRQQGELEAAVAAYQRAIALEPDNFQFYNNLGNVLQEQGKVEGAIAQYQQSLALQPDNAEVYFNLGNAMSALGQLEAAITYYESALNLGLERAEVHNNLALVLQACQQSAQAVEHLKQAIALQPDDAELLANLGIALYEQNEVEAAITYYQQALAIAPEFAATHLNLSFALLASGDLLQGFAEYEWRFHLPEFQVPELPGDRWDGSDLKGKNILLYAEQGFGDAIQFIRYVPLLAEQGVQVIVVCQPELERLFASIPGITQLIVKGDPLPTVDFHLPLLSLPQALSTTLETIPSQVPYLSLPSPSLSSPSPSSPPPFVLHPSSFILSPSPSLHKIGITWASAPLPNPRQFKSYRNKTASLPLFMALQSVPGVELHSLQVGVHADDIAQGGFGEILRDRSPDLHDFADTAAVISELDLIISVDTAVAHLAGAMGKPVWLLLPYSADWRWLLNREDSPWYPTMRLFRQFTPGDWAGVMARVLEALCHPSGL